MNEHSMMIQRENIIRNYVAAYNQFDTGKMLADLDEDILFENLSNGELNLSLSGLNAFKEQAELAKNYFSKRMQTIRQFRHREQETEVDIDYAATLAMDIPGGPVRGTEMKMQGRSIFSFKGERIIKLTDIS